MGLNLYLKLRISESILLRTCHGVCKLTNAQKKANSVPGFIMRTVGPKNPQLFSKLYKSLVRLILEYCSPVWCPHLKKDLQKVQRRASK